MGVPGLAALQDTSQQCCVALSGTGTPAFELYRLHRPARSTRIQNWQDLSQVGGQPGGHSLRSPLGTTLTGSPPRTPEQATWNPSLSPETFSD